MPQIAGFRGLVWDSSKVDITNVVTGRRDAADRSDMVRDTSRAVYRYHQVFPMGGRTVVRKSWFAAIALDSWTGGLVRPHEATDPNARTAELARISSSGVSSGPVLVGYRDAAGEVDRLFRKAEGAPPLYDIATPDGTNHKLWRCNSAELIGTLRPLFAPKKLWVLDGHARYEAMVGYRDQLARTEALPMYCSVNFGLGCLVNLEDPALVVGARHRVVRAGDISAQRVLDAAKRYFIVESLPGAAKDVVKQLGALTETVAHQPAFIVVFSGEADAWKLTLSPDISPVAEGVTAPRAIQKYDPIVVDQLFLPRIVPDVVAEVAADPEAVLAALGSGAKFGIIMRPLTVDQIVHVDAIGALLPAGSTAFYPQIAPHLIGYVPDPNEDLV